MSGTNLSKANFDNETKLIGTNLQFSAVKSVDISTASIGQEQVSSLFGDGSVVLPAGLTRPAYWPEGILDWSDFTKRWRDWQAKVGYVPPVQRE